MPLSRIAISAVFAAGLAALPLSAARAQYYGNPWCNPFPLSWPFCVAGVAVGTAAMIVSAPFRAFGAPYYYYPYPPSSAYPVSNYQHPPYYYGAPYYQR